MFRDILVMNVPDSDAAATLEKVAATAARLGGAVSGMGIEVDYAQPIYMYADAVVFMSQAFRDAEEAGHARVEDQLRQLSRHCAVAGVGSDVQIIRAAAGEVPGVLATPLVNYVSHDRPFTPGSRQRTADTADLGETLFRG